MGGGLEGSRREGDRRKRWSDGQGLIRRQSEKVVSRTGAE